MGAEQIGKRDLLRLIRWEHNRLQAMSNDRVEAEALTAVALALFEVVGHCPPPRHGAALTEAWNHLGAHRAVLEERHSIHEGERVARSEP
jgi:hypothetical protein